MLWDVHSEMKKVETCQLFSHSADISESGLQVRPRSPKAYEVSLAYWAQSLSAAQCTAMISVGFYPRLIGPTIDGFRGPALITCT